MSKEYDVIESGVRAWEDRGGPVTPRILDAIDAAGYVLVKLPTEDENGDYDEIHISGDEIRVHVQWIRPDTARDVAASLLRAADQLDALEAAR